MHNIWQQPCSTFSPVLTASVTSGWLKTPKGCECTEEKLIFFSLSMCNIWQQWPCSALFDTFATLVYVRGWPGLCQRMTWFNSVAEMECTSTGTVVQDLQNYLDFGKAFILCFTSIIHYPSFTHTHTKPEWASDRKRESASERVRKTTKN